MKEIRIGDNVMFGDGNVGEVENIYNNYLNHDFDWLDVKMNIRNIMGSFYRYSDIRDLKHDFEKKILICRNYR